MQDIGMMALFELIIWVPLSLVVGSLIGAKWLKWSGIKCFGFAVALLLAPFLYGYIQFLVIDRDHAQYCEKYRDKILYKANKEIPGIVSITRENSATNWDLLYENKVSAIVAYDNNGEGMTGTAGFYKISLSEKQDPRCSKYWNFLRRVGGRGAPEEKCIAIEDAPRGLDEAQLVLEYREKNTRLTGHLGKHFTLYELLLVDKSNFSVLAQRAQILYSSAPNFYEYFFRSRYISCNQRLDLPDNISPIEYFFGLEK